MNDPNRMMKWLLIVVLIGLSLIVLYPPKEKLKGGIDLVGGTSLLFEIDTTGLDAQQQRDLSGKVMRVLKDRVDPKGQMNLEWRPVGASRLEIRMPRPPEEALERREAYNKTIDVLQGKNLKRRDVEDALNAQLTERPAKLAALVHGVPERKALSEAVAIAYDKYHAAQGSNDKPTIDSAAQEYEKSLSALLATSLPLSRLTDVLALQDSGRRTTELAKLRTEFPAYDSSDEKTMTKVVSSYDAWAKNKADLEDPSDLKRRLRGAGVLEFRILAERDMNSPDKTHVPGNEQLSQPISKYTDQLAKFGPKPRAGDRYEWFAIGDVLKFTHSTDMADFDRRKNSPGSPIMQEYAGRYYVLAHRDAEYSMLHGRGTPWALKSAMPQRSAMTGENTVTFRLDPRGGRLFGELTGANINRPLCIFLDNEAMSHANIRSQIFESCEISGNFTKEAVDNLVRVLEAGSLPARLKETPLREQTVGPSLGDSNRRHGVQACVLAAGLVVFFMLIYYGIAGGGIADLAMLLNILFVLAVMALMQATFTLPGIAGVILTVGMAVDANVLIFERIREERARGLPFKKALNVGYAKAFTAIFDANVTTLISCLVLVFMGTEEVKGFGVTLGLGIATSLFTALFCTRLAYNTLAAKGWITDFHMKHLITTPHIDWVGLRRYFLPISAVAVTLSVALFIYRGVAQPGSLFDIEFLGGTSVQVDLKPGVSITDEQMRDIISSTGKQPEQTAVKWLEGAATDLATVKVVEGDQPGRFVASSDKFSGEQLSVLMRKSLENALERDGVNVDAKSATFTTKTGQLTLEGFKADVQAAAKQTSEAAGRLRGARIQSVGEEGQSAQHGTSYEIVTVETNRPLVQEAILAILGDKLAIQRAVRFTTVRDEGITKAPFYFVQESSQYLSDVIGGERNNDVRKFRGGAAVVVNIDSATEPLPLEEFKTRLREVGLQPEFEHARSRETEVIELDTGKKRSDGKMGYGKFAVLSADESFSRDDNEQAWTQGVAETLLAQVNAALGSEKSLSKVLQFAPQIAGQTTNKALGALVLSMLCIAAYVWIRFGNKDFGAAAILSLVHDVAITLGLISISHYVFDTSIAKLLLFDDFRLDLPMVAAVLTIIGYSLNDTIVVFDRIRENRGKAGNLSAQMINDAINQTMSRTLLTSLTVFMTVFVLYVVGGAGVHGSSVALLVGVLSGTYSTFGIAVPLIYSPRLLNVILTVVIGLGLVGLAFGITGNATGRLILISIIAIVSGYMLMRLQRSEAGIRPRQMVGA
ncbi:MAG: protein translocase subunit SecD [Planctomycetes bacterium]|nr:protein translocase subunit SecD [Planctomycetota bacterium]MBI3833347.1 protein translocase subunit SecD [Planctomycetota bacterium]